MRKPLLAVVLALLALPALAAAGPREIALDPKAKFLFLLSPTPNATLAEGLTARGFLVVEAKPENTDEIRAQARALMAAGVPAGNLTFAGGGEAGLGVLHLAGLMHSPSSNFVMLAACPRENTAGRDAFLKLLKAKGEALQGRFLSLYDTTDPQWGSCRDAIAGAAFSDSVETVLETGRGATLFDRPLPVWTDLLARWAGLMELA